MQDRFVYATDDVLLMLDALLEGGDADWNECFADRSRPCPFFVEWPDENLVAWFGEGLLTPGRVLELGCGQGRNAAYLAGLGCGVDATFTAGSYDLVYDSGCFHHLPPHRRQDYVELVHRALKHGGSYGLVCFRPEGGSGYTDQEVYEQASLGGGLGYSEGRLRALWDWAPFAPRALRQMRKTDGQGPCFGEDFLWALLATEQAG
jgi:SAM-dependent methyltransferase